MAGEERAASTSASTDSLAPGPIVQKAEGISINCGNFVQAGRDVIQNHYHGLPQQAINMVLEALRLVPNLRQIQLDLLSKATPGTAIWILQTEYFLLWLKPNGDLKILWGTGIPGAGKSVMASIVIKDLEERAEASGKSICVGYIYFRYSDASDLTVQGVLEILVKQTLERHPDCAPLAEQVYGRHLKERTRPTQGELLQLLRQFIKIHLVTFYVLDALDEAPEKFQVDIVNTLASLDVKLFITSRPLKAIEATVSDAHSFTIVARDHDLDLHISREITRSVHLKDLLDADPPFKSEVISTVKKKCAGMFLHAFLQLSAISRCTTARNVRETLAEFPSDIKVVYHQTWDRILSQDPRNVRLAKTALIWVSTAVRSMTLGELRYAIAANPDTYEFEPNGLMSSQALLTLCCGLINVEAKTKLVRLVHYTAKETLRPLLLESFPHPHSLLAAVCLTHLARCRFQNTRITSENEFLTVLEDDPLLMYASHAWSTHARESQDDSESQRMTVDFVSQCSAFPSFTNPIQTDDFDILTPLHILAVHALPLTLIACDGLGDPNVATRVMGRTPLMLASWCGNINMVEALLGRDAVQVNLSDKSGWSALMHAGRESHDDVAEALLAHPDIQINLVDNGGWSTLMQAACYGHESIANALLERPEIQVNLVNGEGWSALMEAAFYGHEDIAKALLERPETEVNLVNHKGWSALMSAARHGHEGIARALLARPDIQVNMVNNEGWSALMGAARSGHQSIANALLARPEIDVNLVNRKGWTALMGAAFHGHEGIVQALITRSETQVRLSIRNGITALSLAKAQGHSSIVDLLHSVAPRKRARRGSNIWNRARAYATNSNAPCEPF